MITTKQKWITIISLLFLILILAGFRCFKKDEGIVSPNIESLGELEGSNLGGIIGKIPDHSAKIFFESLLGEKLGSYRSYSNVDETLSALRTNEIQAAWFADVTADYLVEANDGLRLLKTKDSSEPRLDFAMAVRNEDQKLCDELNTALTTLRENGSLETLVSDYIKNASSATFYYEFTSSYSKGKPLYVGVTGAVPPIDMVDSCFRPYGFSVALMDQIQQLLNRKIILVVIQNDTAFSNLMAGNIDVLFAYGSSKDTVGTTKNYKMTDGYYTMDKYSYVVLE